MGVQAWVFMAACSHCITSMEAQQLDFTAMSDYPGCGFPDLCLPKLPLMNLETVLSNITVFHTGLLLTEGMCFTTNEAQQWAYAYWDEHLQLS